MKSVHISLVAVLLISLLSYTGCKKDDPYVEPSDSGTVNLNISTEVNGMPVLLDSTYVDIAGYQYKPTALLLYLSHITFLKADGTEVEASEVELLDLEGNTTGTPTSFSYELDNGDYVGLRFNIGVDSSMNAIDPANYAADHPLSLYSGTYWDWNTGYRFLIFEAYIDSLPNSPDTVSTAYGCSYHTGTNALYAEADLSNAQQSFTLSSAEKTFNYDLVFDLNKLFYNDTDTIIMINDRVTHTTDNMPLAQKITDNITKAFHNAN